MSQDVGVMRQREVVQLRLAVRRAGRVTSCAERHVAPEAVGSVPEQLCAEGGSGVPLVVHQVLVGVPEHDVRLGAPVTEQCHVFVQSLPVAVSAGRRGHAGTHDTRHTTHDTRKKTGNETNGLRVSGWKGRQGRQGSGRGAYRGARTRGHVLVIQSRGAVALDEERQPALLREGCQVSVAQVLGQVVLLHHYLVAGHVERAPVVYHVLGQALDEERILPTRDIGVLTAHTHAHKYTCTCIKISKETKKQSINQTNKQINTHKDVRVVDTTKSSTVNVNAQ